MQDLEENFNRILGELKKHQISNKLQYKEGGPPTASTIAQRIFLAHSTSDKNFNQICEPGRLLSPTELDIRGIKTLRPEAVEITLDTANFVFLYAAPFAFPSSGCGLLFSGSLENSHCADGKAVPFDSGGLINHFNREDLDESASDFLKRHELPLPKHRDYLQENLASLFNSPWDYVVGNSPIHLCPMGLTGGDRRRWTHEVRIPREVEIRSPHLKAVFVPLRLSLQPKIENLLRWSMSEGFDVEIYEGDRENNFAKLSSTCIDYLRNQFC